MMLVPEEYFEEIDFSKWDQCADCIHREICRGGLRNGEVCNEKVRS